MSKVTTACTNCRLTHKKCDNEKVCFNCKTKPCIRIKGKKRGKKAKSLQPNYIANSNFISNSVKLVQSKNINSHFISNSVKSVQPNYFESTADENTNSWFNSNSLKSLQSNYFELITADNTNSHFNSNLLKSLQPNHFESTATENTNPLFNSNSVKSLHIESAAAENINSHFNSSSLKSLQPNYFNSTAAENTNSPFNLNSAKSLRPNYFEAITAENKSTATENTNSCVNSSMVYDQHCRENSNEKLISEPDDEYFLIRGNQTCYSPRSQDNLLVLYGSYSYESPTESECHQRYFGGSYNITK
ncbi:3426_t:CDS:1 [Scutellospora calospora]|uniref:3426_t:CDS:1 n=1 Tax=Scutellospora calospora TaxID=85575 RepID=A0ACA9MI91_9GLOM|nr:3426_t:CDS:1 [Scutellospora calospora]